MSSGLVQRRRVPKPESVYIESEANQDNEGRQELRSTRVKLSLEYSFLNDWRFERMTLETRRPA